MSLNKKIMFVRNANLYDFGGGERYSINLALGLERLGFETLVASSHKKIISLAKANHIKTTTMPWLKSQNISGLRILLFGFYLLWQIKLVFWYIGTIKTNGVDIIHLQSRDDFIAGTIAGKILRKKIIWTDHADLKYIFINIKHPIKNPVGKIVYLASLMAHKIIVVSKSEKKLITKSLNGLNFNNSIVIYNGVTDAKIDKARKTKMSTPTFSLTSRLVDTKGIREVLSASKRLEEGDIKHAVLLIGEGPREKDYRKVAGESVVFLGYPDKALSYVAGSDYFLHPTYNEAFSISIVEAAMLGKPVIVTNVGGNTEIIKNRQTGLIIEEKNSAALAEAMIYAINNAAEMKKMGKNLRKTYLLEFNFENIVKKQLLPLYN